MPPYAPGNSILIRNQNSRSGKRKGENENEGFKKLQSEQQKVQREIEQLQNRQKILLNRKTDTERRARTRRLIEHGAILESIFPATVTMTGEEVKAFLLALSRLPGADEAAANVRKSGDAS